MRRNSDRGSSSAMSLCANRPERPPHLLTSSSVAHSWRRRGRSCARSASVRPVWQPGSSSRTLHHQAGSPSRRRLHAVTLRPGPAVVQHGVPDLGPGGLHLLLSRAAPVKSAAASPHANGRWGREDDQQHQSDAGSDQGAFPAAPAPCPGTFGCSVGPADGAVPGDTVGRRPRRRIC